MMVVNLVTLVMVHTCVGIICEEEEIFPDNLASELVGEETVEKCSCSSTKITCHFLQLEILGSHEDNSPRSLQEASRVELR